MVWLWLTYLQLWKINIFSPWGHFLLLPVGPRGILWINKIDIRPRRKLKKREKFKILLESWKVTSKQSADNFMGRWDRMVPQKMDFKKKIFEKVLNSCNPPPGYRTAWYISLHRVSSGLHMLLRKKVVACCILGGKLQPLQFPTSITRQILPKRVQKLVIF